jgi:hypothetical protein
MSASPSWIEQMAWAVTCPTCRAPVDHPCVGIQDCATVLEFNHATRNQVFHRRRQQQRAVQAARERAAAGSLDGTRISPFTLPSQVPSRERSDTTPAESPRDRGRPDHP